MSEQSPPNKPINYVAIGASAGGLEALEAFFRNMPMDSDLGFVVIQHLSQHHKSMMPELLAKYTDMPAYPATNGMQMNANTIYLIPPKKNLTIEKGQLFLFDRDRTHEQNLPIDLFFESLAKDQAEHAIAIILSGTGSDGTRGARFIKTAGGLIIAQDEASAKFGSMPFNVAAAGVVDIILPPDKMPEKLLAYINYPCLSKLQFMNESNVDEHSLPRIFALIKDNENIDFTQYKPSTVSRRIERRMGINQIDSLADYVQYLESHPHEIKKLYNELLIGVTQFFRDKAAFNLLAQQYLPNVFKNAFKEVRIWVAGCATGEEAYTLALLCKQQLEKLDKKIDIKIFATDMDETAINHGSLGIYPESIIADVPRDLLAKYFIPRSDSLQASRDLREMVVFAKHNIIKDPPFTNIDLVSCRNLLIYLDTSLQQKVLDRFNFSLNTNGLLFLGPSESINNNQEYFSVLDTKWKLFRCKGLRKPLDFTNLEKSTPYLREPLLLSTIKSPSKYANDYEQERLLDRISSVLSDEYVPITLIVNEEGELIYVLGDVGDILRHAPGRVSNNVIKILPKTLAVPIATGIHKVFESGEDLYFKNIRVTSAEKHMTINAKLKAVPGNSAQVPLIAIFLEQHSSLDNNNAYATDAVYDLDKMAEQRIQDLEQELQMTRESLQATVEEVETANEELQATNEELIASNEELQSTNEELQSVNEELHTVNAEHQSKIVELVDLNNDLDNLLISTRIATIFLDNELNVRGYTPEAQILVRIIDADIGRPVSHLTHSLTSVALSDAPIRVIATKKLVEQQVVSIEGKYYLMRVLPYYTTPQTTSGVVLTFLDIDQTIKAQNALTVANDELKDSEIRHRIVLETIVDALIVISDQGIMESFNPAAEKMFGYAKEEVIGQNVSMLMPPKYGHHHDQYLAQYIKTREAKIIGIGRKIEGQRKNGERFPMHLSVAEMTINNQRLFNGIIRELSAEYHPKLDEEKPLEASLD